MGTTNRAYTPNAATLRAEETTRVAWEHIEAETAARRTRQRALKAARLARDAAREGGSPRPDSLKNVPEASS